MTDDEILKLSWEDDMRDYNGYIRTVPFARALLAAGASEGQAHPIPVPTVIDRSHANQAYVTYGFRDEAMCTEFINATNSHRKPIYTHPSAEIAALRERIAGMEKDADGPTITADVHADAARYQWLRNRRVEFDLMGLHSHYATKLWNELGERFDWDDVIDSAIAKEPK
ncbi:hypothetical protein CBA19CS22_38090 [Caballeronia novacaledonica]|uniref:Uncharacterized protein n=1 Tax=Caballeronia novacaledonica TaxID=1544861 RepID=A0ACB5R5J8_9BURK|nr:hypothetical protein CBA19CS22_38090 [Caballeronia novacaledonica]